MLFNICLEKQVANFDIMHQVNLTSDTLSAIYMYDLSNILSLLLLQYDFWVILTTLCYESWWTHLCNQNMWPYHDGPKLFTPIDQEYMQLHENEKHFKKQ